MQVNEDTTLALPILAVVGSLCWQCFNSASGADSLSRCTGCKRAVYCSSKCQKKDWKKEHKSLCKVLKHVNKGPTATGQLTWPDFKDLQRLRLGLAIEKGPDVRTNAQRAVQYQPSCEQCFRTAFDNENHEYRKLIKCEDCDMVFFCSDACRSTSLDSHQQQRCSDLQEHAACEAVKIQTIKDTGELGVLMPTEHPHSSYVPLSTFQSWKEYFDFSCNPLAPAINEDFQPLNDDAEVKTVWRLLKLATESSSFILTILAGLEAAIPDLASRTSLTLHLLGPDLQELKIMRLHEELLHLLPNLQHLLIGLIGPDFPITGKDSQKAMSVESCPECKTAGRTRQIFFSRSLYHDFCSNNALAAMHPPDMLVAFNSGNADAELQSWQPTLQKILDTGKPAVFTTYNRKEALEEGSVFEKMGAAFLVRPELNRWRGVLPYLDAFEARYETYYQNFWWYVVKGKKNDGCDKSGDR